MSNPNYEYIHKNYKLPKWSIHNEEWKYHLMMLREFLYIRYIIKIVKNYFCKDYKYYLYFLLYIK